MTRPTLIQVPYHLGRRDVALGAGVPVLAEALADGRADLISVDAEPETTNEIAASMAVVRALADRVRGVRFPIVLAGNCNSCLGTVTGVGGGVGVVWFDAHPDFNTPDTTTSGFFDGMALAMLTGAGWGALRTGLAVVPEEHVVHVGARDMDRLERRRLETSRLAVVRRPPLDDALAELRTRVDAVYVHVDLDVLDPSVGRANRFAAEDGLTLDELERAIEAVGERFEIRAAALTAYEPECDPQGAIPQAALAVYERLLATRAVIA
jgi:arginase